MQTLFYNRHWFVYTLLVAVAMCFVFSAFGYTSKWVTTAGLLLDVTGLVQLDISGLFSRTLDHYKDEEKYPYGPPSSIMREVMKEDASPITRALFMEPRVGFIIIVCGCFVQLVGSWL